MEAKITGGLEDPGIVPVNGLGHFADCRPFCVMRFIRGRSLKEAIEQKLASDDWSTSNARSMFCAALFCQKKIADAEPLLLFGYEGLKSAESSRKLPAATKSRHAEALQRLIDFYTA